MIVKIFEGAPSRRAMGRPRAGHRLAPTEDHSGGALPSTFALIDTGPDGLIEEDMSTQAILRSGGT